MELFESTKPENQIRSNRKPNINQKKKQIEIISFKPLSIPATVLG